MNVCKSTILNVTSNNIKKNNVTTLKELDKVMNLYFKRSNNIGFLNYYNHTYTELEKVINT